VSRPTPPGTHWHAGRVFAPRRLSTAVAAVAAVIALAACSQQTAGTPGAAVSPGEGTGGDLQSYYSQQIEWGSCADYATSAEDKPKYQDKKFECGKLTVPLDYAKPDGTKAQIAVLRQKATGDKIGSLLFNPGGPGASGNSLVVSLAPQLAGSELAKRFDLVGFDPRGVGASTPTLDCLTDADWATERARVDDDPSPAGVAFVEQENKSYADKCTKNSGGAEVLANVGTRDVAKDLDILRAALGDQKLTYLGYSYGTRIGSTYAEQFPQNVRALVLDGALDPTETTVDRTVEQNAGFQQAFDAYAADCAKQPTCPLGTDPKQATAVFQQLTRPLLDKPLTVGDRQLSYQDAVTGTIQALYAQDLWPVLSRGISGLANGDGKIIMLLADFYYGRGQDGHYSNSIEAFNAISCVDEERITDRNVEADLIKRSNEAAPFRDNGRGVVAALEPCAFWPVPTTMQPHVPNVQGLPPTLVVSTTGDPATPYKAGVDLAKGLKGQLITYNGTQHTIALQGNKCVDSAVTDYLINLKVPASDPNCPH
jgi:pimeloyl-ACP methyl ester carboxylesterase